MTWLRTLRTGHRLGVLAVLLVASAWLATTVQTAGESAVAAAAQAGDLSAVRSLIVKKADVNLPQGDGSTALLWAAYNSDAEMTKVLLAAGAKPDVANKYGVAPLLMAARQGVSGAPVVDLLLKAGADPRKAEINGETPLMAAGRTGSVESIKLLITRGVEVNEQDSVEGESALMRAANEGNNDAVKALLEVGANPDLKTRINTILDRKLGDFPTGGFTAMMFAARNGHADVVKTLIDRGANASLVNGDGVSALALAVINDRFDFAAQMLDWGVDANAGNPLFWAIDMHDATTDMHPRDGSLLRPNFDNKLKSLDMAKVLLDHGANPNQPFIGDVHSHALGGAPFENATPFYKASINSDVAGMELLLNYGADVSWTPSQVKTTTSGAPVGRGANGNAGKPAAFVAMTGGRGAPFGGGPGFDRPGPAPFREVSDRKPADALKVLLDWGADPDAKDATGQTALHAAANAGNLEMIRTLADYGATLTATDKDGKTALDLVDKKIADAANGGGRGGRGAAGGGGAGGRGGAPAAKPEDVDKLLRELMGLPALDPATLAKPADDKKDAKE